MDNKGLCWIGNLFKAIVNSDDEESSWAWSDWTSRLAHKLPAIHTYKYHEDCLDGQKR